MTAFLELLEVCDEVISELEWNARFIDSTKAVLEKLIASMAKAKHEMDETEDLKREAEFYKWAEGMNRLRHGIKIIQRNKK